ncbi:MAG: LacI family DNA-binding transcriptional regulator [Thermomicrobiales bacterium]
MAATMKDVARKAGVSLITVSRVINEVGNVHADTQAKVRAVIADLHYIPNQIASNLRSRQTNTLALLLPTITNAFWTTLARGAEDEAESCRYSLFLCNTDDDSEKEARYLEALLRHRVGGLIIVPTAESGPALRRLQHHEMLFVQIHRSVEGIQSDVVRSDGRDGAFTLTSQLLDAGWRQIAYIGGPLTTFTGRDRFSGYQDAMTRAGVPVNPKLVQFGPVGQQTGATLVKSLLDVTPRPEAIFISNSRLAVGALRALTAAGLRLPQDIAVASFYDIPALDDYAPLMTTVIQPAYEMGRLGVRRLLGRIAGMHDLVEEIVLPNRIAGE